MTMNELACLDGTRVLAWLLVETADQLLALCSKAGIKCDDLMRLPVKRQREKAVERLLLCRALGHPAMLTHDAQGAPMVVDEAVNISISHTTGLVALAMNEQDVIGLDAEPTDRLQVLRVRDKFLNAREQQFITADHLASHVIAWTAKEAVIKAERNSAIDWTNGISIEPFNVTDTDKQVVLTARCGSRCYALTARHIAGHWLTIAVPQ